MLYGYFCLQQYISGEVRSVSLKHKFLFSVFIIFFILVFIALGVWQIIRLNWKNNLILEIENSLKKPPVELTQFNKENFLRIKTSGIINFEKQIIFFTFCIFFYSYFFILRVLADYKIKLEIRVN